MPFPVLGVLAFFNIVMAALAVTPNLGLSEVLADSLHFTVAAVDMCALSLLTGRPMASATVLAVVMASVELVQTAIPGRTASLSDMGLDLSGLAVGWLAAFAVGAFAHSVAARREKRSPSRA